MVDLLITDLYDEARMLAKKKKYIDTTAVDYRPLSFMKSSRL